MKIGILQTGRAPEEIIPSLGDYDQMFSTLLAEQGFEFDTYAVLDGEFPSSAEAAEGWLITGSRFGAYEDHDWIPPLEDLIRAIHAAKRPLVGICFGHQIIAQALGGRVEKFTGGWSVGATDYELAGQPLRMNAWHQDQVTALPQDAKVIGQSDFCANAFLAYGDHIWTSQPHPEFSDAVVAGLIKHRGDKVTDKDRLAAAQDALATPVDQRPFGKMIADFFKKERS